MQHPLIGVYLHIFEHGRVVAEPQRFAAGNGHVPENDFPGSDIGKLLQVGIVCHMGVEICKNGGTVVLHRMFGVVDMESFDGDPFRHITGVAEIMLAGIGSSNQAGADWSAACGHESAVAYEEFSLPRTAVVGAQIDEVPSVYGCVLDGEDPAADGVYSLMSQVRVSDGGIGNPHMGVEPGKDATVVNKILGVVGSHDSPVSAIVDVVRLSAVHE